MVISNNDKSIFICNGDNGSLKQVSIQNRTLVKSFETGIEDGISAMCISKDDQFLFLSGRGEWLKQMYIPSGEFIKDYYDDICGHMIYCNTIIMTMNEDYLFLTDNKNGFLQISDQEKKVVKVYKSIINEKIRDLAVSEEYNFLFLIDQNGNLNQYCINDRIL